MSSFRQMDFVEFLAIGRCPPSLELGTRLHHVSQSRVCPRVYKNSDAKEIDEHYAAPPPISA